MRNAGLEEAQAGIKIDGRNINDLRYADAHHLACIILVSHPGIEHKLHMVEVQSLNHWTTREILRKAI